METAYITFSKLQKNQQKSDKKIKEVCEQIGLTKNGNDFIIVKYVRYIVNDESILKYDKDTTNIQSQIEFQGNVGLIELDNL